MANIIAPSHGGKALLVINAIFTSLAIASSVSRFIKNLKKARAGSLQWRNLVLTDALVLTATVLVVLNGALRIVSILLGGVGWDQDTLTTDQLGWALKALFIEELAWTTSLCLLKFALIILYGRIFVAGTGKKSTKIVYWTAHVAVGCLLVGSISYYLGQCKPLAAAWTPGLPGGKCAPARAGWFGTGIANLITDVIIFSVPAVWLTDLQMHLHNKIVAGIQLFIGAIVTIISLTRIFFVAKANPDNITGSVVNPDIFSCIELNMAIVFASVAGIAGREAISNFVDRFLVARPRTYAERYRHGEPREGSGPGTSALRLSSARKWAKMDGEGEGQEGLVRTGVREVEGEV
ncbi:MFS domain-containing protein [Physcia stellaris]|nr:MFS domain-containing protein [Physcia stellaris]